MIRRLLIALAVLVLAPLPAAAQDDLAVETARVEDLTSIREIKHLQARWGHLAIGGNWRQMARLLTDDAVVELQHGELLGPDEIEADLRETQGGGSDGMPIGRLNLRLWISPVITLAPDGLSATGRWHEIAMTGVAGRSADWSGGTWVVEYRREQGVWSIARMRYYHQFDGPYATGWDHSAEELERAPYHYTPDEAGRLLPERRSADLMTASEIDHHATLLLGASEAQNLVSAYGYYLDRGMYADILDLFSDEASIMVDGEGFFHGREGLGRFLARFGAAGLDPGEMNDRLQLMPAVAVSETGDFASVRVVEIGMNGRHGGEGQWSAAMVVYMAEFDEDHGWRLTGIARTPLMRANYADGWQAPLPALLEMPEGSLPDSCIPRGSFGIARLQSNPSDTPPPDNCDAEPIGFGERATSTYVESNLLIRGEASVNDPLQPLRRQVPDYALDRAEAFDAAENVSNAYGYYIDQFAWRNTAALFSRDGWKELSYIGTFVGQDNVLASLIQRYGEGGPRAEFQAIHQLTQPYVTPSEDGQRAQIRSRLWQFNSGTEPGGSWIGGIYENQVVREDGVWRIHGMDLDYVWLADYATGWTGVDPEANARFGVSPEVIAEFGPQAPLRGETFAPYPRIAPMGFHYVNPVSGREPDVWLHWSDGYRSE